MDCSSTRSPHYSAFVALPAVLHRVDTALQMACSAIVEGAASGLVFGWAEVEEVEDRYVTT